MVVDPAEASELLAVVSIPYTFRKCILRNFSTFREKNTKNVRKMYLQMICFVRRATKRRFSSTLWFSFDVQVPMS